MINFEQAHRKSITKSVYSDNEFGHIWSESKIRATSLQAQQNLIWLNHYPIQNLPYYSII